MELLTGSENHRLPGLSKARKKGLVYPAGSTSLLRGWTPLLKPATEYSIIPVGTGWLHTGKVLTLTSHCGSATQTWPLLSNLMSQGSAPYCELMDGTSV